MNTVTCPKCHKTFKLRRPVAGGKFRCAGCGEVFSVATGGPSSNAPLAPAPVSPGPRRPAGRTVGLYHRVARQPTPSWAIVLAVVGVVGIAAMLLVFGYIFTRGAGLATTANSPKVVPPPAAPRSGARSPGGVASAVAESARKIETHVRALAGGVPGHVRAVVNVQSLYSHPLDRVSLTITAMDESSRPLDSQETSCRDMPSLGLLTATVDFYELPKDVKVTFSCVATVVKTPDTRVCIAIGDKDSSLVSDDFNNTITLTGHARNTTSVTLTEVKVVADFHNRDGSLLCTAVGSLKGGDVLKPGQIALYEIVADGGKGGFMVQTGGQHLALRLVGTKQSVTNNQ